MDIFYHRVPFFVTHQLLDKNKNFLKSSG